MDNHCYLRNRIYFNVVFDMNKATAKALESSINHWKRMRDGKRKKSKDKINSEDGLEVPYGGDCALCREFNIKRNACDGCPIFIKTGMSECMNSPYWEARTALDNDGINSPEFKSAAQKMIDFLESLREVTL